MPFDLQRIAADRCVRSLEYRPRLESTNRLALELAQLPQLAMPLLVLTDEQTAGRGRGDNRWWSAPGALTFSVVLDAGTTADTTNISLAADWHVRWPKLSLATALAVQTAVQQYATGVAVGIRWPNDVHAAGRKICGVLPEMLPAEADRPARLVLGIGVNVNNSFDAAPAELRGIGISLADLSGLVHDLTEVLLKILAELMTKLAAVARGDANLVQQWSDSSLLTGRTVQLQLGEQLLCGHCLGIDADGALLLLVGGQTRRLFGGTILHVA